MSKMEIQVDRVGQRAPLFTDLYHSMHRSSWVAFMGVIVVFYLVSNAAFAGLYLAVPDSITNVRPGNYFDAFSFSVQTMSTIGYGTMSPANDYANLLVTLEAVFGLLFTAVTTGMVFAKFAVPTARIRFPKVAVVADVEGVDTLMLRIANERSNRIVEADVSLTVAKLEILPHGERVRRFYDLELRRKWTPIFAVSWTIYHPIDEDSPLYGYTPEDLAEHDIWFVVTVSGTDEHMAQRVGDRAFYSHEEIRWDHRYVDIVEAIGPGHIRIDFDHFDDVKPA